MLAPWVFRGVVPILWVNTVHPHSIRLCACMCVRVCCLTVVIHYRFGCETNNKLCLINSDTTHDENKLRSGSFRTCMFFRNNKFVEFFFNELCIATQTLNVLSAAD